jgi:hypothetical protein
MPEPAPFPVRTDAGHPVVDGFTDIICSFVLVCFCFAVWACLYPMPTVAGVLVFLAVWPLFGSLIMRVDPTAGAVAIVLAFTVGMIVVVRLSRLEHRIARYAVYRHPRHVVRLLLLSVLTIRSTVMDANLLPRPGEPVLNLAYLRTPQGEAFGIGVLVVIHLLLWKAGWMRRFWHGRLEAIGLRPRD